MNQEVVNEIKQGNIPESFNKVGKVIVTCACAEWHSDVLDSEPDLDWDKLELLYTAEDEDESRDIQIDDCFYILDDYLIARSEIGSTVTYYKQ